MKTSKVKLSYFIEENIVGGFYSKYLFFLMMSHLSFYSYNTESELLIMPFF